MSRFTHCSAFMFGRGGRILEVMNNLSTPGPGSYTPNYKVGKKKEPEWTIYGGKKDKEKDISTSSHSPSPSPKKTKKLRLKKDTSANDSEKNDLNEEPDRNENREENLNEETLNETKKKKKKKGKKKDDSTPGPGQYELKSENSTKAFSFAGRPFSATEDCIRPVQSAIQQKLRKNETYSQNHKDDGKEVVGPGSYNISKPLKAPVCKFGTEKKCNFYGTSCSPGPKYEIRDKPGKGTPSIGFGEEPRSKSKISDVPGPGSYVVTKKFGSDAPVFSFGKEDRGTSASSVKGARRKGARAYDSNPTPASYHIEGTFGKDGKKITISPCPRKPTKYNNVPGPKYYPNSDYVKRKYPAYRIGSAKRKNLYDCEPDFPAPNTYNPNPLVNSTRIKSPKWRIGTSKRPKLYNSSCTPGVGMYNMASRSTMGPKYSLRGKFIFRQRIDSPGPAKYSKTMCNFYREPAWKFGTSTRDDDLKRIKRENFPGPANYTVKVRRKHSNNIKIGKEKREIHKVNETPGPGKYKIPCTFDDINDYTREQGSWDENYRYV